MKDQEKRAERLIAKIKERQLADIRNRMPEDRQGVEVTYNGRTYLAFIRRLTPAECGRLQGVPEWYDWKNTSETQQYKMLGNGWQVDTIKHCFSFMPKFDRPIRVWSLFDGMACAAIALRDLGIEVGSYVSSEIDKGALAAEARNFPEMIQVGSVTDINVAELVKKYGVPDLLCGGSPCFVAGTQVLTLEGYKNIEDVQSGDMVLTHKNRYRKVLRTGGHEDDVYTLRAQGFLQTTCTANHPFYAREKRKERYIQENRKYSYKLNLGEPEWIRADELSQKYYIANNVESQECENPLGITEEEAWVIGRYIADGHTRKDLRYDGCHKGSRAWQLILSIGDNKLEQFKGHFKELNYSCYAHSEGVHRVVFSSKRLVEIVEAECGRGSTNKRFGEALIRLPKHLLEIVLRSYLEGDSCYIEEKRSYSITTVSKLLALSLQRVVSKLYGKHICVTTHRPAEFRELCGRMVHQNTQYLILFSDHDLQTQERPKLIDGKMWYNAKSFTPAGRAMVYNLEVEEDNSYTANNIVVHNCQSFSMSGKRKGMATSEGEEVYTLKRYLELKEQGFQFEGQSYLFWEYMRILTELRKYNPDILFFLENVEMLDKWERCLSHAIGVQGVHINSALVSAQQRRRIYWSNFRVKDLGIATLFDTSDDPFEWPSLVTDIPQPEDTGEVINDILEDTADGKYYLRDHIVEKLMKNTDGDRLNPYLLEPQFSVEEAYAETLSDPEYEDLSDGEKRELAQHAYDLEKRLLKKDLNDMIKKMFSHEEESCVSGPIETDL